MHQNRVVRSNDFALKLANVSPKPTADLFAHLSKITGEERGYSAEFLESHPLSGKRAKAFSASFDPKAHYQPALSREQWDALSDICWKRPEKK